MCVRRCSGNDDYVASDYSSYQHDFSCFYRDAPATVFLSVELLSSMLNVGLGVGFLPGMFYDRFGPTLASGAGLIVCVPIFILIWSSTRSVDFYSNNSWLMAIYFLIVGKLLGLLISFSSTLLLRVGYVFLCLSVALDIAKTGIKLLHQSIIC